MTSNRLKARLCAKIIEMVYQAGKATIERENWAILDVIEEVLDGSKAVFWHVEDLVNVADKMEGQFDPSKYPMILDRMIAEHDASKGINWTVIEEYLDRYGRVQ